MATAHSTDPQYAKLIHRFDLANNVRTLLAHLLEIGRPAPPAELASRCRELRLSPEIVKFICSVPGSPLRLTGDGFVTYVVDAWRVFSGLRICGGSVTGRLGSEGTGGLSLMIECDLKRRKRQCCDLSGMEFMSARKRTRLLFCDDDETVTSSKALFSIKGSRSAVEEASSLHVVYRRRSPRNDGGASVCSLYPCSPGKLVRKSETMPVHSDVGFSRHAPNTISCFKDSKTVASADTMHHAVLESNSVNTLHIQPLALTDDPILRSFSAAENTEVGDPHLEILNHSFEDMSFPLEMYKISPSASGSQLVPSEVQETQINTDQPVHKGPNNTSVFPRIAKDSPQTSSFLRKGSKSDNARLPLMEEAGCHSLRKTQKLNKEMKTSHKSKLRPELQNLPMPSRKSLSNKENPKTSLEQNTYPSFESFVVEEEEGSGGYGTVFKARRKSDGEIFAIKCPHPNAPRHHVYNELSMLQRFGGKNFIIRLEDSFKYEDSRCFVLEHVIHDRPEVLKKEINVTQLQWYAYCMFEALANLHKHGIVHRDIKPGNFLFSREINIGYLIDFNLAMDLHQKNRHLKRPKMGSDAITGQNPVSGAAHIPNKIGKFVTAKNENAVARVKERGSIADSKNLKAAAVNHTKTSTSLCKGKQALNKSQVALDDSGVTSLKDMTSSKAHPQDQTRQCLPSYKGRKEILELAKKATQAPKHKGPNVQVQALKSKRILAPPKNIDRKQVFFSPMPLQSSGVALLSGGLIGHKGDDKKRKEGPSAGTKGFRAPEVLFRSAHQGPKIDVWSAGVSLLYLLIGKTPFYGDINDNIKAIATLRGSEDLWEVAKLHNQESAFPLELLDVKFLTSTKLREWCQKNSKRPPSFINEAPDALYDFLDKCLTVNPRLRISAEDALQHEFLTPCRDMLLQQALLSSPTI